MIAILSADFLPIWEHFSYIENAAVMQQSFHEVAFLLYTVRNRSVHKYAGESKWPMHVLT